MSDPVQAGHLVQEGSVIPQYQLYVRDSPAATVLCRQGYHLLGEILEHQQRYQESLLPLRLSVSLLPTDEHYARTLCDAFHWLNREEEGLAYLKTRITELGHLKHGGYAWMTLVETLYDYGHIGRAVLALEELQRKFHELQPVHSFAARFWSQIGQWDRAEDALEKAHSGDYRSNYLASVIFLHRRRGQTKQALSLCYEWMNEQPLDIESRRTYVGLVTESDGLYAAFEVQAGWLDDRPHHDELERLRYGCLKQLFLDDEQESVIRRRIEHDSHDD